MLSTFFSVTPQSRIPQQIWQNFCTELPWCSEKYQFGISAQNTLLALILAQLLDNCITWCQYDKLTKLLAKFQQLTLNTQSIPQIVNQFYTNISEEFRKILIQIQPSENSVGVASSNSKLQALREDIDKRRKYIQQLLLSPNSVEIMAKISRGIAISVYLQSDFHSIATLQRLVKKNPREVIIHELLKNQQEQNKDHFILEDQILIPISYTLQIPIHCYLNNYDSEGTTLTKRRVHAYNQEQALMFLIENEETGQARMLYKYHNSIDIKNHIDYEQTKLKVDKIPLVQSYIINTELPRIKNRDLIQCVIMLLEQIMKQMAIEHSNISELWLKKINEIIQQGDTKQLISKKQQVEFQPQLILSISDLQAIIQSDDSESNYLKNSLMSIFESTQQFFENLVITQVTTVRDNLFDHIASIKGTKVNQSYSKLQTDYTISKENALPSKPKILDKQKLFNKSKIENTNTTFNQQKLIYYQSHIQAKTYDQDLPDPSENLTQHEIDSESSSQILSESEILQKKNGQVRLAKIEEYHTSEDESDSNKISPQKICQHSSDSEQEVIICDNDNDYDYEKILDNDFTPELPNNLQLGVVKKSDSLNNSSKIGQNQVPKIHQLPIQESIYIEEKVPNTRKSLNQKEMGLSKNYLTEDLVTNKNSFQKMYLQQQFNGGRPSLGNNSSKTSLEVRNYGMSLENVNLNGSIGSRNDDGNDKLSFVPNNSRKSTNIQNRMSSSQSIRKSIDSGLKKRQNSDRQFNSYQQQQRRNCEELDISKISEMDENRGIDQSVFIEFECPACYESFSNHQDIKVIHDDHKICAKCLETWIKVKFNSGQWNLKFFKCPIQQEQQQINRVCSNLIDPELIKQVLSDEEFEKLCERSMLVGFIDIECPWEDCLVKIRGMPPKSSDGIKCPDCEREICWICRNKSHEGMICPKRLEEIKGALMDERMGCCPECLEIFMKNEGCQHVQCNVCATDFCFACSAPREPIMKHGTHYHRDGCEFRVKWVNPDTNQEILEEEYDPVDCEICKKTLKPCPRPLDLASFKKLAHMNF